MNSSRDEDVQVLHDQSGDESFEDIDLEASEVQYRKENVRIVNILSNIDEGELLDICFMYSIVLECKLIRPSGNMRVTEALDEDSIMMGLAVVKLRQVITVGYLVCSPSGSMRPNPSPTGMAPKKTKSSKMAKVTEAMKK
ncbi:hypothetical protein JCGZ_18401 [Jatropha curcas]|uniref:Uncharacterized protein n=1 Tax=Jatropha curcas TaxID=180498 RepID=A0A067K4Z4_JATCU|nr:hypothetical protein JCGZ_18401 [Jatropha curcas]